MKAGRSVIALVEDEPLLRVPLAQGLDASGFTVVCAASGTEALSVLTDPEIDIAIIDVNLPGRIGGLGVLREARRTNPGLKAVLISGRPPAERDLEPQDAFLAKPFRLGELLDLLDRLLGTPAAIAARTAGSERPSS